MLITIFAIHIESRYDKTTHFLLKGIKFARSMTRQHKLAKHLIKKTFDFVPSSIFLGVFK